MANEKNLIPIQEVNSRRSREEHSQDSRKGGQKSGEARRQKKNMKSTMKMILSLDMPECEGKEELKKIGIDDEDLTLQTGILVNQAKKALAGNLDSAKFVRDTAGEYIGAEEEKEEQNHYKVLIPAKDMPPAFVNVYRDIQNREHREYWLEGRKSKCKIFFCLRRGYRIIRKQSENVCNRN